MRHCAIDNTSSYRTLYRQHTNNMSTTSYVLRLNPAPSPTGFPKPNPQVVLGSRLEPALTRAGPGPTMRLPPCLRSYAEFWSIRSPALLAKSMSGWKWNYTEDRLAAEGGIGLSEPTSHGCERVGVYTASRRVCAIVRPLRRDRQARVSLRGRDKRHNNYAPLVRLLYLLKIPCLEHNVLVIPILNGWSWKKVRVTYRN